MREKKTGLFSGLLVTLAVFVLLGSIVFLALGWQARQERKAVVRYVAALSPDGTPPETIEGLEKALAQYEDLMAQQMNTATKTGVYWKLLASRYVDKKMYGEALKALAKAIALNPTDAALFYMSGLSEANMAKASLDKPAADRHYALAEKAYLRALDLDPNYDRALYGIGVLYVFELDKNAQAIPYLTRYLSRQTRDVDAMFVLARALYAEGEGQKALELYDLIITKTSDDAKRAEAEANRKAVQEGL